MPHSTITGAVLKFRLLSNRNYQSPSISKHRFSIHTRLKNNFFGPINDLSRIPHQRLKFIYHQYPSNSCIPPGITGAENLASKALKLEGSEFPKARRTWTAAILYVHKPCKIAPKSQITSKSVGTFEAHLRSDGRISMEWIIISI